jgi:hypothetical protein
MSASKHRLITCRTENNAEKTEDVNSTEGVTRLAVEFLTRVTLFQYNCYSCLNRSVSRVNCCDLCLKCSNIEVVLWRQAESERDQVIFQRRHIRPGDTFQPETFQPMTHSNWRHSNQRHIPIGGTFELETHSNRRHIPTRYIPA